MRSVLNNKRGAATILAVGVMLFLGIILSGVLPMITQEVRSGTQNRDGVEAQYAAEAGAKRAIAALLAASAVSVAGLLGFVGLIVPHIARLLLGTDYRLLIPGSAILGAAMVTLSDTFARVILAPVELPVGIIMAVLGAPFFLFLLRREL